ncbi:zeta toxin family protein [Nocardioides sp. W7]|uniref:zeta toxin family protein n=1 Tax=Nocardioides sp. W7 TaxID=2931390 RepID=UPI001FD0359B|nr:zeta toxin family protein [Nocardioides sp. W7]
MDKVLRDQVHSELEALIGPDPALRLPADHRAHDPLFTDDLLAEAGDTYRASKSPPVQGGSMMLVTAGPPGAGKSRWVGASATTRGYLVIDPDEIKDLLLAHAQNEGMFDDAHGITLADGRPVAPRELSARVHEPANRVAADLLDHAVQRRENVVIEGTLSWPPLAHTYAELLLEWEYERLDIINVETSPAIAVEGAISRWWWGRRTHALGGRFMARAAVEAYFDDPGAHPPRSRCAATATALWELTREDLEVEYRRIELTATGERTYRQHSQHGTTTGDIFPA